LREVSPPGCASHAQDVLHDEHLGLKKFNVAQEILVQVTALVVLEAFAVVRAINLSRSAETLAGRAADNDVDTLVANELCQIFRRESGNVSLESILGRPEFRVTEVREVIPEHLSSHLVGVYGRYALVAGSHQSQTEAPAATEEVDECQGFVWHGEEPVIKELRHWWRAASDDFVSHKPAAAGSFKFSVGSRQPENRTAANTYDAKVTRLDRTGYISA
jgi:hypothetical protein